VSTDAERRGMEGRREEGGNGGKKEGMYHLMDVSAV